MRVINIVSCHKNAWLRQFPSGAPAWDDWRFMFNAQNEPYDYLVVFDDIPERFYKVECAKQNIIHLATEPPTIIRYGDYFLRQFAWVITQDEHVSHPRRIFHQGGLTWFIGWHIDFVDGHPHRTQAMNFSELETLFDKPKAKMLSVITSDKTGTSNHRKRIQFVKKLKKHYGDQIDFYGRGFNTMKDKLEALRDYRFHVTLENSNFDHYFTEKFTDCVIAGCYPLYYGCPNLEAYFPQHSFTRIDIDDFDSSVKIIDKAINEDYDKKYRAALKKARDLAMHTHNLYPMLIEIITKIEQGVYGAPHTPPLFKNRVINSEMARRLRGKKHYMQNFMLMKYLLEDKYRSIFG